MRPVQALLGEHWRSVNLALAEAHDPGVFEMADVEVIADSGRDVHLMVRGDVRPLLRRIVELELRDMAITTPDVEDVFLRFYESDATLARVATASRDPLT